MTRPDLQPQSTLPTGSGWPARARWSWTPWASSGSRWSPLRATPRSTCGPWSGTWTTTAPSFRQITGGEGPPPCPRPPNDSWPCQATLLPLSEEQQPPFPFCVAHHTISPNFAFLDRKIKHLPVVPPPSSDYRRSWYFHSKNVLSLTAWLGEKRKTGFRCTEASQAVSESRIFEWKYQLLRYVRIPKTKNYLLLFLLAIYYFLWN